jgi:hypothetical protein
MKKIAFLTLLSLLSFLSFSQSVFNRVYVTDSLYSDYGFSRAVIQTSDGGYLVAGANAARDKIAALKLTSGGDTIWSFSKRLGAGQYEIVYSTIESSDGNFVLGGLFYDTINQDHAGFLIKISSETGDLIWKRDVGNISRIDEIYSIKETSDKGFVLSGVVAFYDTGGGQSLTGVDALLIKTDSLGVTEWEKIFGGAEPDDARSIEITSDNGFILLGTTYSFGLGLTSNYVVKTDNLGNMLWQKSYGGTFSENGWSIKRLNDGNYVICGQSNYASDSTGAYIAKINPDGIIIWERNFKGAKQFQDFEDVKQLPNGNIVACGINQLTSSGSRYQGILKALNPTDGSVVWEKQYKYNLVDSTQNMFYGMDICDDGGIVMSGHLWDVHTYPDINLAMWVVKTDCKGNATAWSNTCSQAGIEEFNDEVSPTWFTLYPNPTSSNFSVQCTLPDNSKNNTISIYDAMGKLMQIVPISAFSNTDLEIDASGFAAGVYSIVLSSDKQILQTQKLVRME